MNHLISPGNHPPVDPEKERRMALYWNRTKVLVFVMLLVFAGYVGYRIRGWQQPELTYQRELAYQNKIDKVKRENAKLTEKNKELSKQLHATPAQQVVAPVEEKIFHERLICLGDSLSKISLEEYGTAAAWPALAKANHVPGPCHTIYCGRYLQIPDLSQQQIEDLIKKARENGLWRGTAVMETSVAKEERMIAPLPARNVNVSVTIALSPAERPAAQPAVQPKAKPIIDPAPSPKIDPAPTPAFTPAPALVRPHFVFAAAVLPPERTALRFSGATPAAAKPATAKPRTVRQPRTSAIRSVRRNTRKAEPGWYAIPIRESEVPGLASGIYPALLLRHQRKDGFWDESHKAKLIVTASSRKGILLFEMRLKKPPRSDNAIAADLGRVGPLVNITGDRLMDATPVNGKSPPPKKTTEVEKRQLKRGWQVLEVRFPKHPNPVFSFLKRRALPIAIQGVPTIATLGMSYGILTLSENFFGGMIRSHIARGISAYEETKEGLRQSPPQHVQYLIQQKDRYVQHLDIKVQENKDGVSANKKEIDALKKQVEQLTRKKDH